MYQGNVKLRKEGEVVEYTQDMIQEYTRCAEDIIYFAEKYFWITTIDHGRIKIQFNGWDFQKKLLKAFVEVPDNKKHLILMMSRQSGKCFFKDTEIKIRNKKTGIVEITTIGKIYEKVKNI